MSETTPINEPHESAGWFRNHITCPHCGWEDHEHCEYPRTLRKDGDSARVECGECEREFSVTICVDYTYCAERDEESSSCIGSLGDERDRADAVGTDEGGELSDLLRSFQEACEMVVVRGDSHVSATTKERAILRNAIEQHVATLRQQLAEARERIGEQQVAIERLDAANEALFHQDAEARASLASKDEEIARLRAARDAWEAFASHQEWCRYCGEDGVKSCDEGAPLQAAAKSANAALGEAASPASGTTCPRLGACFSHDCTCHPRAASPEGEGQPKEDA